MAKSFGGVDITIDGMDELQATMEDIKKGGAKKAITKGLRAGARIIQAAIVQRATGLDLAPERSPQSTSLPVGAIAADIIVGQVKTLPSGDAFSVSIGPGKYTAHVAGWVEYGHENVSGKGTEGSGILKLSSGKGQLVGSQTPPHPFIRPAFEESQNDAVQAAVFTIQAEVLKVTKSGLSADVDEESAVA